MHLCRLVSWPYIRRNGARYTLLALGVALAVTIFLGMHAASRAMSANFRSTVSAIAGGADLQVSAGEAGVPETLLDTIRALEQVQSAVPLIEASVETRRGATLLVLGLDLTGDAGLQRYSTDPDSRRVTAGVDAITFIAQPESLLLSADVAAREHLRPGDRYPLRTSAGLRQFVVRGILPQTPGAPLSGNFAVMDVYAAQVVFGRGERFDHIDIRLHPGSSLEETQDRIRGLAAGGFSVAPPASRSAELDALLASYSLLQNAISAFAMALAAAMIQSSFRLSVAQRRVEIGIIRSLGGTRRQICVTFLAEGALTGLVGAVVGSAGGAALSMLILRYMGELLRPVLLPGEVIAWQSPGAWPYAAAIAGGILASTLAAIGPAFEAASLTPSEAMRRVLHINQVRPRIWSAIAGSAAITVAAMLPATSSAAFYSGIALVGAGVFICVPWMSLQLITLVRPLLVRVAPVTGAVAADSLVRAPGRTGLTIAVLTLTFSQVIVVSGISLSGHATLVDWVRRQLDQDLMVSGSPNLVNRSFRFPDSMISRLKSVNGVMDVEAFRQAQVPFRDGAVLLVSGHWTRSCETDRQVLSGGAWRELCRAMAVGSGAVISETFGVRHRLLVGDSITFSAAGGVLTAPVLGIIRDFQDPRGVVYLSPAVYRKYWLDDRWDKFRVFVHPGVDAGQVRQDILNQPESDQPLSVLTRQQVENFIFNPTGRQVKASYVQVAAAALLAVLGLMNLLAISVVERRGTLAVFRVLGAGKHALYKLLLTEASIVAVVSVLTAAMAGAVLLRVVLGATFHLVAGVHLDYTFPMTLVAGLLPVALASAALASLAPAASAFQARLAESLAYE